MNQLAENAEKKGGPAACAAEEKWAAVIDDVVVWMPRKIVSVELVKELAGIPKDYVLVRDHNSPNDVVFDDGAEIDLARGNVIYRLKRCEVNQRGACKEPAKLAWILNDSHEITTRDKLSGKLLRELFNLAKQNTVLRDYVSPNDKEIGLEDDVRFPDGPVFISKSAEGKLTITVNLHVYSEREGVKPRMTGLEIAALAYPSNPSETRVIFLSEGNREVGHGETIDIENCDAFDVVRCGVTGGYEASRVEREILEFAQAGHKVTLVPSPTNCVVYHDLPSKQTSGVSSTDVLVPIPAGYPGQLIDLAFLPDDSPLFGKVKGQPQDVRITALGRVWRQVSYHPHNGGGGPAWNPALHGFHTYRGELVAWLFDLQ